MATGSRIMDAIQKGIAVVEELGTSADGEVTSVVDVVGAAAKVAEAIGSVIENVKERAAEGALVLSERDQARIKSLANNLSYVNDKLAERIANS